MNEPIIETMTKLPPLAATICAVCLAIATAGLGVWLAAQAGAKLLRMYRRTLASDLRLQHLRQQYDRSTLNYWIRDSFRNKRLAASAVKDLNDANDRANQERSLRHQVASAGDAMVHWKETAHAE